jgi:hypothetical protein
VIVPLLSNVLVYVFILCCIVSASLQVLAWSRHSLEGAPVSIRALWRPEGLFDEVGLRQINTARRLLTVGGVAYLTYGALMLFSTATGGG